jgi:hypothetical protein
MIKYKKIYCEAYGYYEGETILSEISGLLAVDICHIDAKGMGGDPKGEKDRIENLMAKTRDEHNRYGDKKQYLSYLFKIHKADMMLNNVKFDHDWIDEQIEKYEQYEGIYT